MLPGVVSANQSFQAHGRVAAFPSRWRSVPDAGQRRLSPEIGLAPRSCEVHAGAARREEPAGPVVLEPREMEIRFSVESRAADFQELGVTGAPQARRRSPMQRRPGRQHTPAGPPSTACGGSSLQRSRGAKPALPLTRPPTPQRAKKAQPQDAQVHNEIGKRRSGADDTCATGPGAATNVIGRAPAPARVQTSAAGGSSGSVPAAAALPARAVTRTRLPAPPVYVFWDLDNKYPETLDHGGLLRRMRDVLREYGMVVEIRAYGNYQTMNYVPRVWEEAMSRGVKVADREELRCPVCGAKFRPGHKSHLERHFRELHKREHSKRLAHGPDAVKYRRSTSFVRYEAAAAEVLHKRRGYDLDRILRRYGVAVVAVPMGPQRADVVLQGDAVELLSLYRQGRIGAWEGGGDTDAGAAKQGEVSAAAADAADAEADAPGAADFVAGTDTTEGGGADGGRSASAAPAAVGVLVLVSDDHGFEALLKLYGAAGWRTVVVSNTEFRNAQSRLPWRDIARL